MLRGDAITCKVAPNPETDQTAAIEIVARPGRCLADHDFKPNFGCTLKFFTH